MNRKFILIYFVFILSIVFHGTAFSDTMAIKQLSNAYVGQQVKFEVTGEIAQNNKVDFEWSFSDNVNSIMVVNGGRSCSFTVLNTSPVALNLKAVDESGTVLSEAFLMTSALIYNVEIRLINSTELLLWNQETHTEEETNEFAANRRLSFEAVISPDINEKVDYKWEVSKGTSSDLPAEGKTITVWREEPGLCSIEVEVTNINGILLGKGIIFEEISISSSVIEKSEANKKAWEKWSEAINTWNNSNFTNYEGYEKALELALEALKINEKYPEISIGTEKIKKDNDLVQRALKHALEGKDFQEREKWTECLISYRSSLAAWKFTEIEKAISDVEDIVMAIRQNRDKATWLRDMARAYEEEKRYEDAIKAYEDSLLLDKQEEAIKGIEDAQNILSNIIASNILNNEAEELILSKDYSAASNKLKESLSKHDDDKIKIKLNYVEEIISELKAKASQLKRDGNEHARRGRRAEALVCYLGSMKVWPEASTDELVKRFEKLVPEEQRLPEMTDESLTQENNPEAARLLREGTEFYRAGNYNESLDRYKKSYEIEKNQELKNWIERIEGSMKAQKSIDESNRLIREGNALYSVGRYQEALDSYMASLELYPNKEIENFIKHIKEILNN